MANGSNFVSSSSFTLPDEIFQKLRSSAFLTGISPSKEQTRGIVEAGLNVGAEKASKREALAKQFEIEKERNEISRQRVEALSAFEHEQIRGQKRASRSAAISGFAQFGALALLLRGGTTSTTTKTATGSTTVTKPLSVLNILANLKNPSTWFSSIRYKENVSDVESLNSERIYDLKPVSYNYKEDKEKAVHYGLIAEEVAKVIPEMVIFDEQGRPDMLDYSKLIVLLLSELQEVKKALYSEVV